MRLGDPREYTNAIGRPSRRQQQQQRAIYRDDACRDSDRVAVKVRTELSADVVKQMMAELQQEEELSDADGATKNRAAYGGGGDDDDATALTLVPPLPSLPPQVSAQPAAGEP